MMIDKTGYDLFEDGTYVGGGSVKTGWATRPRLPNLQAAEAFVLARHLEAAVALARLKGAPGFGG
jgi:hypothetical protein